MKRRTVASLVAYSSLLTTWAFAQPEAPAPAAAPQPPASAEVDAAPKVDEAAAVLAPAPGGLTADTFAERTVASSHTVRAKLAELDASRARLNETTAQFFPRLTGKASYTRLSKVESGLGGALVGAQNPGPLGVGPCPGNPAAQCVLDSGGVPVGAASFSFPSLQNMYALSASLTVPISDYVLRLSNASAGASANRRAAELAVKAEKLKVRSDAQALYYDWLRAKARVAVAEKSLERTRARVKDAKPAYQLGVITKADLMRLEALAVSTEQVALEAKTFRDLAERQMAILMGDKKTKTFQVGEDVNAPRRPIPGELDDLTDEALSKRLELRALTEASRATRLAAKALKVGAYPRLDAFGDVTYANPNQRFFPLEAKWRASWSIGAQLSYSMNAALHARAEVRSYKADKRELYAQAEALRRGIAMEVTQAYLARNKAIADIQLSARYLQAAVEAYRVASELFAAGSATTNDIIDAEADQLTAILRIVNSRIDLRAANTRLAYATGRLKSK